MHDSQGFRRLSLNPARVNPHIPIVLAQRSGALWIRRQPEHQLIARRRRELFEIDVDVDRTLPIPDLHISRARVAPAIGSSIVSHEPVTWPHVPERRGPEMGDFQMDPGLL